MSAVPRERPTNLSGLNVAMCQQETHVPQQTASLFDHLAGAGNQCRWYFEAATIETANVKPHLTLRAKKHSSALTLR